MPAMSFDPLPSSTSSNSLRRFSLPTTLSTPIPTARFELARQPRFSGMPQSVQLFQEKHATEFAHLYEYDDEAERERRLQQEQEVLEKARRVGRLMRESLKAKAKEQLEGRVDCAPQQSNKKGRRPLSLLSGRQLEFRSPGLVRVSECVTPVRLERTGLIPPMKEGIEYLTPDLSTPILSDTYSPDPTIVTPDQQGLGLEFQQSSIRESIHEGPSSSLADTSIRHSTYSWASSFSGETEELRVAAQYVPPQTPQQEGQDTDHEEEIIDTPEKTKRRRKRIIAIAHTVRQLEGIGSREVEDPTLYQKLAKAWNERPGFEPQEPVWTPDEQSAEERAPKVSTNSGAWLAASRPPHTPANDLIQNQSHSSSNASTHSDSQISSPFRYSFASSAHDLVDDGGVERGAQILSEKAWLKTPLYSHDAFFGAHSPSNPYPNPSFQPGPRVRNSSNSFEGAGSIQSHGEKSEEEVKIERAEPKRTLRRVQTDISKLRAEATFVPLKPEAEAGPSVPPIFGLGFIGNWMMSVDKGRPLESRPEESGFQQGEDGVEIREAKKGCKQQGSIHSLRGITPQSTRPVEDDSMETIDLTLAASRPASFYTTSDGRRQQRQQYTVRTGYPFSSHSQQPDCWTPSITSLPQHIEHTLGPPIDLGAPVSVPDRLTVGIWQKEEAEGPEMEEGEWLEDLDSYRSSAICSSPSIFHPSPRQSRLQVRPKSIPPTTPVKEQKHPVFPDMLNTPARREEKRSGEEREDEHLSSAKRRPQSYDRFYYRGMSVEGREDTATVHENTGSAATGRTDRSEAMKAEVEKGYTQTEPVPSVTQPHSTANSDREKGTLSPSSLPRSRTPLVFFILGFFLPLLWLVGGWLLPHSSTQTPETEIIPQTITHYLPRWLFHSNYTVLACRIASLASLSFFLIAGITLAIVLPITL